MKTFLLILSILAPGLVVASEPANALPGEATQALHSNGRAVLYSLEPWGRSAEKEIARLHDYEILGQADLSAAQRSIAVRAFDAAIAGWDGAIAACFDPRHALRIQFDGRTYDFLLCYSCQQMQVFRDGKPFADVGAAGSPDVLNDLLKSLRLPLSHSLEAMEKLQAVEDARNEAGQRRFLAAMPPAIRPSWDADPSLWSGLPASDEQIEGLRKAFAAANPDRDAAIRALLVWFGSGTGRWSGFPGYEAIAGQLLLDYPTDRIIVAAQAPDASEALLEGAARYFAGWGFYQRRPQDMALVPPSLKERLLQHTLHTGDAEDRDRRERATHAFAE